MHALEKEEMDGFEDDASPSDNGTPLIQGSGTYHPMHQQQVLSNSTPGLMLSNSAVLRDFPISS